MSSSPVVLTPINTAEWAFIGSTRKHTVRFVHHTITGTQTLFVDGAEHYRSGWRFKLTGTLCLTLDGRLLELHLLCDEWGGLFYRLTLNGALVPLCGGNVMEQEAAAAAAAPSPRSPGGGGSGGGGGSSRSLSSPASPSADAVMRWRVRGSSTVEFSPDTMVLLVDGVVQAAEGAFVEEEPDVVSGYHGEVASGVRYSFSVAGQGAELTVLPSVTGRGAPECVLRVGDVVVSRVGAVIGARAP
jgi:hypothetical protein